MKKIWFLFVASLILAGCREEKELDLFHLTLGTEADAEVAMSVHSAEISFNGYARWIEVGIVGDFDSYTIDKNIPDWLAITESTMITTIPRFRIDVSELNGTESRTAIVSFTVLKGGESQLGWVQVTQNPNTIEDLKKTEKRAIKKYLSKFDVVDALPAFEDLQVGSVAPFYKLTPDSTVYMQIVKMGSEPAAINGERIYFRYLRYNLLSYLENGRLPNGEGNANDPMQSPASFVVGSDDTSSTQWGRAIQMLMLLGLPVDSEVNIVIASEAGITSEISNVIPYLYNIRYYNDIY